MMGRVGGELDVTEEGGDVGRVERLGYFLRMSEPAFSMACWRITPLA